MGHGGLGQLEVIISRVPLRTRNFGVLGVSITAAVLFLIVSARRMYPIGPDAAAYLYSGLVSARSSGITYRSVFDVKPPGIHLISTALHLVGLGREGTYLLSVLVMWLMFSAVAYLIADLVFGWTGDVLAANVAPVVLLIEEATATAWMHGPMGKYIVAVCTLGSVVLLREDRPVAAVGVATVAAAFWQFAGVIAVVVLIAAVASVHRQRQWQIAIASITVAAGITMIVVAPYVLSGAGDQMIAQVIVISTVASQEIYGHSLYGWLSYIENWKFALPIFATAVAGLGILGFQARADRDEARATLIVVAGWVLVGSYLMSQVGPLDTILLTTVTAPAAGVAIATVPTRPLSSIDDALPSVPIQWALVGLLAVFAVLAMVRTLGYPPFRYAHHSLGQAYLAGEPLSGCHGADNKIGTWWVDAVGRAGEECRSLRSVLQQLK